jgi:multidrug efflux pump subunit AcrA (membrane-fusion protein)
MSATGVPKKRRRWLWWVVLAVVVLAVAWVAVSALSGGQTTGGYTTGKVTRQTLQATVSGSGNAVVSDVTEVQPGITGTVTDLSVKLGQTVKAGQLLFRITNPSLDSQVEQAEGQYRQAKQSLSQAKASVIQAQNGLYNAQHPARIGTTTPAPDPRAVKLAKQQLTTANLGLTAASENVDSASTSLSQAQDNAAKRTVTAPVGGVITILNAQNGQSLSGNGSSSSGSSAASASGSTNSAVEISNLSTLRAQVQINEVDLVNVKVGQAASVTFDALPSLIVSGTVSDIAPTGTNTSGVVTYNVNIALKTVDARLRPTMSCTADIVSATHDNALVAPSSAVHTDSTTQQKYVETLDASGQIQQVAVTTGIVVGTQTEILSGATDGMVVVTGTSTTGTTSTTTGSTSTTGTARRGGGGVFRIFGGG